MVTFAGVQSNKKHFALHINVHRCAECTHPALAGREALSSIIRELVSDEWVIGRLPQLKVLDRLYVFDSKQGARLHILYHWLQKWYSVDLILTLFLFKDHIRCHRTAMSSRKEAETMFLSVMDQFIINLKPNQRMCARILLTLTRVGLPSDLICDSFHYFCDSYMNNCY